jgi:integrase/recombinase XerD
MTKKLNNNFLDFVDDYGAYLSEKGKTRPAILCYQNPNRQLAKLLAEKGITNPKDVTQELLIEYQRFLYDQRGFRYSSVVTFMRHVALFFDFLISCKKLTKNVARGIKILPEPQAPEKQLAHFYNYEEIQRRYLRSQEKWVSYIYLNDVRKNLKGFIKYLRANEIGSIYAVTESALIKYREYLWDEFVNARQDALVVKGQVNRLRCVVRLFRYLCKEGVLRHNPAKDLGWPQYYKEITEKAESLPERMEPKRDLTETDKLTLKFFEYAQAAGKSPETIRRYKKGLEVFFEFLDQKGISNLSQVTKRLLLEYYMHLSNYVGERGVAVSNGYKNHLLWSIKLFFRFLVRFDYLPKDPSIDLESIKEERGLPRSYLNEKEIVELLDRPKLNHDPLSTRDKAMLELLFSTGVRSNELCSLNLEDVDHQNEMLRINTPKGGASFQRIIPVGRVALKYLNLYLDNARPQLENGDAKALFISYAGHRLHTDAIWLIVKKYVHECGFRKNVTTHSLRVTCATLMLKNGADIRYVQEQLGHRRITSTQIYTRLMPLDLKSIHQRCHPREKKAVSRSLEN